MGGSSFSSMMYQYQHQSTIETCARNMPLVYTLAALTLAPNNTDCAGMQLLETEANLLKLCTMLHNLRKRPTIT